MTRRRERLYGVFLCDELDALDRIAFSECLVMSRQSWRKDQVGLRLEAQERRRAFLFQPDFDDGDRDRREILSLPIDGALKPSEIKAA